MRFVATKTTDQFDLQALHRVRERLVGQRTGIINQIRAFLLERGVAVRYIDARLKANRSTKVSCNARPHHTNGSCMDGARGAREKNLTFCEAFGCGHVFGL